MSSCKIIILGFLLLTFLISESFAQCGSCNKCEENKFETKTIVSQNKTTTAKHNIVQKHSLNENGEDDFEDFSDFEENAEASVSKKTQLSFQYSQLKTLLIVFIGVILAGIFVRFKPTRHLRVIFMIGFLIYLGFYLGACPCPISAYQNVILAVFGSYNGLISMLYFIGLIPITYVFGKVWCGWVCHLGTLQELMHIHKKFKFLESAKAQKIMHAIRWILFFGLIIQLAISQTNWFCKIDPFLVAFNLISVYTIGWYLLGLLVITSIFIHRPFCQSACPIGLVLGWISKIPGASVLSYNENCNHCNICSDTCKIGAITKNNGEHFINNIECNLCGECLDSCTKNAIIPGRKNLR